jgi:hypothetical protein
MTMQYLLLIYQNEAQRPGPAEEAQIIARYVDFT